MEDLKSIKQNDLMFTEHDTKEQFFSSTHKHSPRQIQMLKHKTVSTQLKGLKSYKICSLTTTDVNQKSVIKKKVSGKHLGTWKLNHLNFYEAKKKSPGNSENILN